MKIMSPNAQRLIEFVHVHLERDRVAPTRQQMAQWLGFADKKSLLPLIAELVGAGWVRPRDGHRSDDWGGVYQRPHSAPFPVPQKGERGGGVGSGLVATVFGGSRGAP